MIMSKTKTVGTKFFNAGTQNQKILQNYWGNGKTFTTLDLKKKLKIASPGATLTELREAVFNVKVSSIDSGNVGRPAVSYSIPRRRVTV